MRSWGSLEHQFSLSSLRRGLLSAPKQASGPVSFQASLSCFPACCRSTEISNACYYVSFMWDLGTQTQVPILPWQVFYLTKPTPRCLVYLFFLFFLYKVSLCSFSLELTQKSTCLSLLNTKNKGLHCHAQLFRHTFQ